MPNERHGSEVNRERYASYQHEAAMDRLANEAVRNRPARTRRTSFRGIATWVAGVLNGQAILGAVQGRQENGRRLAR